MLKEAAFRYNWISPKDYLAAERLSEEKHEYFEGEVIEMNGASLRHEDIVSNIVREIGNKLKGKDCRVRASNLRTTYTKPEDSLVLRSVGISILLSDIYENITFEPSEEEGLI